MPRFLRRRAASPSTLFGAVAFLTAAPAACTGQTRPFTANDMLDVVQISGPVAIAPDGGRVAFVLPDLTDDWNVAERVQVGSVHVVNIDGREPTTPTPVGRPNQRSSLPAFSPDGKKLALFLEGPAGGQLAVWDLDAREMRTVGAPFTGRATMAPRWATNSRIVYARPEAAAAPPEQPRVQVLDIDDALPGDAFFRRERRTGLRVVELDSAEERTLVADGASLVDFSVSPDGAHVMARVAGRATTLWSLDGRAATASVGDTGDRPIWTADGRILLRRGRSIATIGPDEPTRAPLLLADELPIGATSLLASPSGDHFAGLVADPTISDPEIEPPQPNMYTIARPFTDLYLVTAATGTAVNLTADVSDQIGSPVWSLDGRSLYFVATDIETYEETLLRYDTETGQRSVVSSGSESFGTLQPLPTGLLASVQSATSPPDLWRFDSTGRRTRVTELNPQLTEFAFSEPELFHFDNLEGKRLGALLYRATGPAAGADEPVITYVYEKLTPGVHRFQARQQIFATHGYTVLMPNVMIRVGAPGDSYVSSVVPAVEAVHSMGFTNGRSCMWGGSFGAYATSFVITQTDIFDCAVSRATPPELFRNWASGRDRDSNNIERGQARMGGSPFEVQDRYLSQSAFFHLDQVETPVLITHGMKDYTILFEEGAMMFYALRRLGKEATFVAYREGDHSLYRHSRADALDVHERMLDWFARYLRPDDGQRQDP